MRPLREGTLQQYTAIQHLPQRIIPRAMGMPPSVHCRVLNANINGQRLDHLLPEQTHSLDKLEICIMWDFTFSINSKALFKSMGS